YLIDIISDSIGHPADLSILDVGCGVGNYHPRVSSEFKKVYGVDISAESLAVAAKRNPNVHYSHYNGTSLPFPDQSIDVAFAVCVYHHIPVGLRPAITREVWRVLRPGGMFIIFEHNPANPLTMRVVNSCPFDADAVLLRPKETEKLMEDAGFSAIHSRHILSVPAAGRLLRNVDRIFARLPFGAQFYTAGRRQ
ncbi:MAG: class I SAM-dependent methyltransferase, partial [Proteobacteria bacterium]|nr:class I SAM-dependent methyltransferase [Pseudomonadota bacterium]